MARIRLGTPDRGEPVSPTVTQLSAGNANCPTGGDSISDATGNTTYVCDGATGAQGPSGVVSTGITQLVQTSDPSYDATNDGDTINTGGSFTKNATLLPTTVTLTAGTWLVDVNFTATPDAVTTGDVFPQLIF